MFLVPVLQHPARKPGICSVFCMVAGWRGPQPLQIRRISATNLPKTCDLQDLCDPSRTEAFAMFRSAIAPASMSSYDAAFRWKFMASVAHLISISEIYLTFLLLSYLLFDLLSWIWSKLAFLLTSFQHAPSMLQSDLAWYQLISSYTTSCIPVGWMLDDPTPSHKAHPFHNLEHIYLTQN